MNSDDRTKSCTGAQEQVSVSICLHKNIRRVKSLDDLTCYCVNPTYKYAYATVAGTEASADRLNQFTNKMKRNFVSAKADFDKYAK